MHECSDNKTYFCSSSEYVLKKEESKKCLTDLAFYKLCEHI